MGKLCPAGQIQSDPVCGKAVLLEHSPACLFLGRPWLLPVTAAGLGGCDADHTVCTASRVYSLAFHQTSLLSLDLKDSTSPVFFFFFKFIIYFNYLKGGEGERERLQILAYSPKPHSSWSWARPKPGAWSSIQVSHVGCRDQSS